MKNKSNINNLSLKRFLLYTLTIYPLVLLSMLNIEYFIDIIGNQIYFYVLFSLTLFIIGWFFGQKKIPVLLVILSVILGMIVFANTYNLSTVYVFIAYFGFYPVVTIYQVFLWIPYILKFIWRNKEKTNNLSWD